MAASSSYLSTIPNTPRNDKPRNAPTVAAPQSTQSTVPNTLSTIPNTPLRKAKPTSAPGVAASSPYLSTIPNTSVRNGHNASAPRLAASSAYLSTIPNTSVRNGHNASVPRIAAENQKLPSGPCNYKNLNLADSAKCGCLRFTDKQDAYQTTNGPKGFCVCEHHACFHHDEMEGTTRASPAPRSVASSKSARRPAAQRSTPNLFRNFTFPEFPIPDSFGRDSALPDTAQWEPYINIESEAFFPSIPSKCLLPQDLESRTSSSFRRDFVAPGAEGGLDFLARAAEQRTLRDEENRKAAEVQEAERVARKARQTQFAAPAPLQEFEEAELAFGKNVAGVQGALERMSGKTLVPIAERAEAASERSLTQDTAECVWDDFSASFDEHLPSTARVSPNLDALVTVSEEILAPVDEPAASGHHRSLSYRGGRKKEDLLPKIQQIVGHLADYPETKRNFEERLDVLENADHADPVIEQIKEANENLDIKYGELDSRLGYVERQQNLGSPNGSPDVTMELETVEFRDLTSTRLNALEAEISELRDMRDRLPPSNARPWEVEVVFIPYGEDLRIWDVRGSKGQTAKEPLTDEQARLAAHDSSMAWESLTGDGGSWLYPSCYGRQHIVSQRLKSRGLIRTIQVYGPTARDVQAAMLSTFGDIIEEILEDGITRLQQRVELPPFLSGFLGLHSPWVPLRKLRRDSCLRFLNTSEMVSPALWTQQFLSSSVVMRTKGLKRLYVTQPDSYMQPCRGVARWTWQRIQQLDWYMGDSVEGTSRADFDAREVCWEYDEFLDSKSGSGVALPSLESPFATGLVEFSGDLAEYTSKHGSSSSHIPSALTPARPLAITIPQNRDLALIQTLEAAPLQSPKRIASFDPESDAAQHASTSLGMKRQRMISPTHRRDTPRWSIDPSSPFFLDGRRGTTPFAYATPHSEAPVLDRLMVEDGEDDVDVEEEAGEPSGEEKSFSGGEHNALSDFDFDANEEDDGEWDGMQDEEVTGADDGQQDEIESVASEAPSEYPSRQPDAGVEWDEAEDFDIHVDDEEKVV